MSIIINRQTNYDKLTTLGTCMMRVAKSRDKTAFAKIFDHYAPQIRAYSLARIPGAQLAADELVQKVMTRVWLKAGKYNARLSNLNTWIFTLARNCHIDYFRRNSRYMIAIDPAEVFNEIEDGSSDPLQQIQAGQAEEAIQERLRKLPQKQTEVLTKVYLERKSHQQISEELSLPLGTVKSRVRLALKKLEILLAR